MNHESYAILCAAVVSGHASHEEMEQLSLHVRECDDCRARLKDFAQLSAQAMPFHADRYSKPAVPPGMTARFIDRARAEGAALDAPSQPVPSWQPAMILKWGAACAVFVSVAVGALSLWRMERLSHAADPITATTAPPPAQQAKVKTPTWQPAEAETAAGLAAKQSVAVHEIAALKQEIATLRADLSSSRSAVQDLARQLTTSDVANSDLRAQLSNKDAQISELGRQLQQKDAVVAEQLQSVIEKQAKLDKLAGELSDHEREVARERQLLAASAQARDLITARNLHIIDVHDNDRSGRQRPFGRIFYTEGHSLVFYAYDLNAASPGTEVKFHVWGGKLGDQKRATSLGVFRSEDSTAGRWVLSCDDPHVLAQINTVFVTAESAKNNLDHPKGRRILFAFLGDQPNHP